MTFLAYLAAQPDWSARCLTESLSGLTDGANDIGAVVAHLRATLGDSEAVLAVDEEAKARNISRQYIIRERLERKEEK